MSPLVKSMLGASLYKKTQGKVARQATFAAIALVLMAAVYQLQYVLMKLEPAARYGISFVCVVIFLWFSYRIVNYPKFADFLIQVEAEMRKVSWPTAHQVVISSGVVITVMFILMIALFGFDWAIGEAFDFVGWAGAWLFEKIGIF